MWTGVRSPSVQTVIARKLLKNISTEIGAEISVGRIRYGFNQNLIIRDILIEDLQKDTLLYINKFEAVINDIDLNSKKISLESVVVENSYSNIYQINDSIYNFSFIADSLKTENPKPFKWIISCDDFSINSSLMNVNQINKPKVIINKTYIKLTDIFIDSSHQDLKINYFNTHLNNKPFINSLSSKIIKIDNQIIFNNLNLITSNSNLKLDLALINLPTISNSFSFQANISSSNIVLNDFSEVLHNLRGKKDTISLTGAFTGSKNYIKGESIKLNIGDESTLIGNFNINNYRKIEDINYIFDITKFFTSKHDVTHILNTYFNADTAKISNQIALLNTLTYKGEIIGDYYNLKNRGLFLSQLGQIETDVEIIRDSIDGEIWLDGNLKAMPLYLNFLDSNNFKGEIAFNINTSGSYSKSKGPNFDINGNINHLNFNKHTIDSIGIIGNINQDQFIGRISSFDPDLRFDFDGILKFDTLPSYNFIINLYYANLYNLGLSKNNPTSNLSLSINADFVGDQINNSIGEIQITDIFYFDDTSYFATDSIYIISQKKNDGKELDFISEYFRAHFEGNYNALSLIRSFKTIISHYLPSLGVTPKRLETNNVFSFDFFAEYPHPLTKFLIPKLKISPGTKISGDFDARTQSVMLTCESDEIEFDKKRLNNIKLKAFTRNNKVSLIISSDDFKYSQNNSLKNFNITSSIYNDSIKTNFNWNNWLEQNYSGNINTLISLTPKRTYTDIKLDIFPSNIIVLDTLWFVSKSFIKRDSTNYVFHNINIDNGNSKFELSGIVSDNPEDSIIFNVENINMEHLNTILMNDKLVFGGDMTGNILIKDIKKQKRINSNLNIKALSLNGKLIGDTRIKTKWNNENKSLLVDAVATTNSINNFLFNGYISFENSEINIDTYFNNQAFVTLEPFLQPTFSNLSGTFDGKIKVYGNLINPSWKGEIMVNNAKLLVESTKVYYNINDSVHFNNHDIIFKNINAHDNDKNIAVLNGSITHESFRNFLYDIKLETNKILAVNLKSSDNPYYYGKIYGSGYVEIVGPDNFININIVAKTENYSFIQIPLEGKGDIKENDFIEFTSLYSSYLNPNKTDNSKDGIIQNKTITNLRIDLEITPDIEVQIIFDPQVGDMLRANGFAHLTIESLGTEFNMYGDYTITKGDFMFTLQNIINKRLNIQQGSTVSWTGHPLDAVINLDAIYKVRKASVFDLTQDEEDREKKVDVNTHLLMTGKLVKPNISFAVDVPSATHDEAIDQLNSLPEEDLNKQVISLLLVNRFTALTTFQTTLTNSTSTIGATTASELLSNQLSSWMSQISNDFDIGFVYRPGDESSQQEVEIALSTNLFNDRVILNGNFGYSEDMRAQNNTPLTGDGSIEYKLNEKGNLRLRAFQKVNNDITYTQAPYTQGFGIFYTEEFDDFDELMQKMFKKGKAKQTDKIKLEKE